MAGKGSKGVKSVLGNTFWQLLVVYILLVVLISLNVFWKYTLHFEIFAIVLAVLGGFALHRVQDEENLKFGKATHYLLLALGVVLILAFRIIPYLGNSIPLGYDPGIYKYCIESFSANGFHVESWIKGVMAPGFFYLMFLPSKLFSSEFLLIWGFIGFSLLLGLAVYLFAGEYFGKRAGMIALLLYAVSIIQFKVFTFLYYKNVIALSGMLFSLYFLKRAENSEEDRKLNLFWFVAFGVLTGIMHRPTFFLFGIAFICYTVQNYKHLGRNILSGLIILGLTCLLYLGFWQEAILPFFKPVVEGFIEPGTASGTFISFFVYQFSTLYYLPFAILGFMYLAWKRKFNMLFFLTLITGIIVYFQFFFFNRFIIHLDIFLIVLASSGFSLIIENKKKLGITILILMLFSAGFVTLQESLNAKPLINEEGLNVIKKIDSVVESNAQIISISSEYSPWVLGYSNRKTIAPGLFEKDQWTQAEWEKFWNSESEEETRALLADYVAGGPIYVYAGTKRFNNRCFEDFLDKDGNKLLKYTCENG